MLREYNQAYKNLSAILEHGGTGPLQRRYLVHCARQNQAHISGNLHLRILSYRRTRPIGNITKRHFSPRICRAAVLDIRQPLSHR